MKFFKFKNMIACSLVAGAMGISQASIAQVATLDVNSLAQLQNMKDSLSNLKDQLENQKNQLNAMTGRPDFGAAVGNSANQSIDKYPEDWNQVYSGSNPYQNQARQTLNQLDAEVDGMNNREARAMTRQRLRQKNAHDQAMMQKAYNDNLQELKRLESLESDIDKAQTQKQVSDVQAKIAASQGSIEAQNMRLEAMSSLQNSQQRLYQDQKHRAFMNKMVGDTDSDTFQSPSLR